MWFEGLRQKFHSLTRGSIARRGQLQAVLSQIASIDLAPQMSRSLQPLHVQRDGRLGHVEDIGKLRRIGVRIDLGQDEKFLGLDAKTLNTGRRRSDRLHEQAIIQSQDLGGIDFCRHPLYLMSRHPNFVHN